MKFRLTTFLVVAPLLALVVALGFRVYTLHTELSALERHLVVLEQRVIALETQPIKLTKIENIDRGMKFDELEQRQRQLERLYLDGGQFGPIDPL